MKFNKIIIWGDKLFLNEIPLNLEDEKTCDLNEKRGTFSYIFYGFYRAFNELKYKTYWFDHEDNLINFDFTDTLIIAYNNTININVDKFPINNNSYYLLHNVYFETYFSKIFKNIDKNKIIHYCLPMDKKLYDTVSDEKIIIYHNKYNFSKYINNFGYVLINLWATDLLPEEIRKINHDLLNNDNYQLIENEKTNNIYFVGTLDHNNNMRNMIEILKNDNININLYGGVNRICFNPSIIENIKFIRKSLYALALQCDEQIELNYCSCRIFKNISYGRMPICNNPCVNDIFGDDIIYDKDIKVLYEKSKNFENNNSNKAFIIKKLILDVINNHTFISRIDSIINLFNLINQ